MFSIKNRLKYYLSQAYNKKIEVKLSKKIDNLIVKNKKDHKNYYIDLLKHLENLIEVKTEKDEIIKRNLCYLIGNKVKCLYGDIDYDNKYYLLSKSRPIKKIPKTILLNLNIKRHWTPLYEVYKSDISWEKKNNKVIWRGTTTGKWNIHSEGRYALVNKYYKNPKYDIGLSFLVQLGNPETDTKYIKKKISIKNQLKSKYIISVEGNDVSTGLKWMLYSNSVVLMPKPQYESWIMEGRLKPYVHYIPLKKDFSDLNEIYKWCLENDKECKQIAKNGKEYMKQFLNKEKEDKIIKILLIKYLRNISYI